MNRGSLLRSRGISINKGSYYHEPVTMVDMRLYKTSNNFVLKSYKKCLKTLLCIFNTFNKKIFSFAHVILTMLSSMYHFWGVHNLYQAKSANSILESKGKLVCFSFFHFSFFVICFRYSISLFVFHFWFFPIRFSYSFFAFRWHFTFFLHSKSGQKSYFDIRSEVEYSIFTLKILFWHWNWCQISYFDIQSPFLKFKISRISYFDIQNPILLFELRLNIVFWHSKSYVDV